MLRWKLFWRKRGKVGNDTFYYMPGPIYFYLKIVIYRNQMFEMKRDTKILEILIASYDHSTNRCVFGRFHPFHPHFHQNSTPHQFSIIKSSVWMVTSLWWDLLGCTCYNEYDQMPCWMRDLSQRWSDSPVLVFRLSFTPHTVSLYICEANTLIAITLCTLLTSSLTITFAQKKSYILTFQ